MPKSLKSKEDVARLKLIKQELLSHFANLKTTKEVIKVLKAERNSIKAKYVKAV
jgi:hypothetical protein